MPLYPDRQGDTDCPLIGGVPTQRDFRRQIPIVTIQFTIRTGVSKTLVQFLVFRRSTTICTNSYEIREICAIVAI